MRIIENFAYIELSILLVILFLINILSILLFIINRKVDSA